VFGRIATAALGAGLIVGFVVAILQQFTLVPMIHHAEVYERAAQEGKRLPTLQADHNMPSLGAQPVESKVPINWMRFGLSVFFSIGLAVGYGLLLTGAIAVSGREVSGSKGVLWGMGGFATFALAPSLGLAPELPGSTVADLFARQVWWVGCAAGTAAGLVLLVFGTRSWAVASGIALLVAPHLIGAPHPGSQAIGVEPPELAAEFAASSLVVAAVFWCLLGWTTGTLYSRLASDRLP